MWTERHQACPEFNLLFTSSCMQFWPICVIHKTSYNKTGNVRTNVMLRHVRITIVDVQKQQVSQLLSMCPYCIVLYCIVALVIQLAQRMHHIILLFVACLALPYFSTLSHKRYNFQKKVTEYKMCVMIFPITFVWNISHFKKNSAWYCHKHRSSCEVPLFYVIFILYLLFLPGFNRTWIFSKDFWKSSNQISWKSVQRELSCSMWTDGQTDRQTHDEANSHFSQFCKCA